MSKLPIEYVPNTAELDLPPKFRWVQRVDTFGGEGIIEHCEEVNASLQDALIALIEEAKRLQRELKTVQGANRRLSEQVVVAEDRIERLEKEKSSAAQQQRPQPARPPAKPK